MKLLSTLSAALAVCCVSSSPCSELERLDITGGALRDGYVDFEGLSFSADEWFEKDENGTVRWYGCPCLKRTCMWKCCGKGQAHFNRTCNGTDFSEVNPFSPKVYEGTEPLSVVASDVFFYMYNDLCDLRYPVDPVANAGEELYIQRNANLYEITNGLPYWHLPTSYCVDMMLDGSSPPRVRALVCFPDQDASDDNGSILHMAYAIGLLISSLFLLITFLAYAFTPELRNLHGLCLMAYCSGLLIAYVFLAYLKLQSDATQTTLFGCYVIAFILYYAFQTSFFWLNVMCYDIWRTFSIYRGSSSWRQDLRRFLLYGAYAWGSPAALLALVAFMQLNENVPLHLQPRIGNTKCWFNDRFVELLYFYTPVLILVLSNAVFFVITAHRIRCLRQETVMLKGSESTLNDKLQLDKQRYGLYLKLFLVMGMNWTVEVISFVVGGSNWLWILTDLSNMALGVFIFIIFVWKNNVKNLLLIRVRGLRTMPPVDSGIERWDSAESSEDTRISTEDWPPATSMRLEDMH